MNAPAGGFWYRCSEVDFVGEVAQWQLDPASRYSFYAAYEKRPHLQLTEENDDAALRSFVRVWGPLRFSLDTWSGTDQIETYRNERDNLRAAVLTSVDDSQMVSIALTEWLEGIRRESSDDIMLHHFREKLQVQGNLHSGFDQTFRDWVVPVTSLQIESAVAAVEPMLSGSPLTSPRFLVDQMGRRKVLKAELGLFSLRDALYWMVWQDIFQKHPFQFCAECRRLFQPESSHEMKFCSSECAHRQTAREWQRRAP